MYFDRLLGFVGMMVAESEISIAYQRYYEDKSYRTGKKTKGTANYKDNTA